MNDRSCRTEETFEKGNQREEGDQKIPKDQARASNGLKCGASAIFCGRKNECKTILHFLKDNGYADNEQ